MLRPSGGSSVAEGGVAAEVPGQEVPRGGKLLSDERTASLWNRFCSYRQIKSAAQPNDTGCWRKIAAKKRFIDPMVQGEGRISKLSSELADSLNAFRENHYDYWVCGQH